MATIKKKAMVLFRLLTDIHCPHRIVSWMKSAPYNITLKMGRSGGTGLLWGRDIGGRRNLRGRVMIQILYVNLLYAEIIKFGLILTHLYFLCERIWG